MAPQQTTPEKKTSLLVDDDSAFRQSAAELLTSAGYNVLQAADGESTRRLLDKLEGTVYALFTTKLI
jgi:CheY-like chemotaxis protein